MKQSIAQCYMKSNSDLLLFSGSRLLSNPGAMDMLPNKALRRQLLILLEKKHDTMAAVASVSGVPASHLGTIKKGNRQMGDEMARKFEAAFNRPLGWMDQPSSIHELETEIQNQPAKIPATLKGRITLLMSDLDAQNLEDWVAEGEDRLKRLRRKRVTA